MVPTKQWVNHDLIARLYDDPGRDCEADPNLVEFFKERMGEQRAFLRILDMGCGTGKQLGANHEEFADHQTWRPVSHYFFGNVP